MMGVKLACRSTCAVIVAGQRQPILIATRPVDFRCGHRALALIVQTELKLDPHSGVTIVFRSKRGDRLKILVWDGTGLVMVYKVLEQGSFAWPKVQDGTMRLSRRLCLNAPDHRREPMGERPAGHQEPR